MSMGIKSKFKQGVSNIKCRISDTGNNALKIWIIASGLIIVLLLLLVIVLVDPKDEYVEIEQTTIEEYSKTPNYIEIAPIVAGLNDSNFAIETPLNNVQGKLTLAELGLDDHMLLDYAISIDMRGESTHAIAILLPQNGFEQKCTQELLHYVADKQKYTREQGNEEAYKLAKQAVVNKYGDYIILVLCDGDNQSIKMMNIIKKSMQAKQEGITLEELLEKERVKQEYLAKHMENIEKQAEKSSEDSENSLVDKVEEQPENNKENE